MKNQIDIVVCMGSSCFSRGNQQLLESLQGWLEQQPWRHRVVLKGSRCEGTCIQGPNIQVNGRTLHQATAEQVKTELLKALEA
jgi:NADH:ubiquinone oxidoreductase subunit E